MDKPVWTQHFILRLVVLVGLGIIAMTALFLNKLDVVYGCGTLAFFVFLFF